MDHTFTRIFHIGRKIATPQQHFISTQHPAYGKNHLQHINRRPLDTQVRIPPIAELAFVNILIGDIDPADIADFPINHANFAVIAVIEIANTKRKARLDRRIHLAAGFF